MNQTQLDCMIAEVSQQRCYLQSLLSIGSLTLENLLRFPINQGFTVIHIDCCKLRIYDELVTVGVTMAAAKRLMPRGGQSGTKRLRM